MAYKYYFFYLYKRMWNILNEIGELLKNTRLQTGISLEEVGNDLNIKPIILDNIESGNIGCFKDIYVLKDYIKEYSKYLGLNQEEIVNNFNEYLFNYTSKIPVKEIEEKIKEKRKIEETTEIRIASPYTDSDRKYKTKSYILLYILVIALVALAIFWSVKQITIDNRVTNVMKYVR